MTKNKDRTESILNAAEALFFQKGYEKSTINDILEALSISKGAFYHYFKSKEDVMNAIVMRSVDEGVKQAEKIVHNDSLSVYEKILKIILAQQPGASDRKTQVHEQLEQINNALMDQKIVTEIIRHISPLLAEVVRQGIKEGAFKTPYPQESVEFILAATCSLFDIGLFQHLNKEQLQHKIDATIYSIEVCLGARQGSFANLIAAFSHPLSQAAPTTP